MAITINDMLGESITFQGPTRVSSFDDDANETVYYEGDPETDNEFNYYNEAKWFDMPIKFIWAASDGLHIELDEEN